MKIRLLKNAFFALLSISPIFLFAETEWRFDGEDLSSSFDLSENLEIVNGFGSPLDGKIAKVRTSLVGSEEKRKPHSLTIAQSPVWQNWIPIDNLGPKNLQDAPVLLTMGPGDYWIFGRFGSGQPRRKKGEKPKPLPEFKPEPANLEGFDVPLMTTRFPNVYDAPGGLKKGLGGYHAWQSRDMKSWVHHGPVTEQFSRWVTNAEQIDGKALIYYDFPNDQDPHVYVDADLTDGMPGENMGLAVADPSHGSDAGFIRDLDGNVHVIIEDWSPISANKRSWDSPLAGRAVSPNGIDGFVFKDPAVDHRTAPTGKKATYTHPHWMKEDPDNYPTNVAEYEIHEPEQHAYGDWAAISIGGQYYLFADYDPAGSHEMSVGWFTSSSIEEPFEWCDHIGKGHPDPDIAFAEGQFYLATQQTTDYVSPGPWVERVKARVGVDTSGDGEIDHWGDWVEMRESYDYISGFSKQVERKPARLDLDSEPAGFGFQVEMKLEDTTDNKSKPMIETVTLSYE